MGLAVELLVKARVFSEVEAEGSRYDNELSLVEIKESREAQHKKTIGRFPIALILSLHWRQISLTIVLLPGTDT